MKVVDVLIGIVIGGLITAAIGLIVYNLSKPKCGSLHQILNILVRQAARWSTAAAQDKNALIAVLHANYGTGYLWAIKDIATDSQIKDATGVDSRRLTHEIVNVQDKATKNMVKLCPEYGPARTYLSKIANE